jgi:hypothetical protein
MSELHDLLMMAISETCFHNDWESDLMGVPSYCRKHYFELERFCDANGEIFFSCAYGLQLWHKEGFEYMTY